MILTKVKVLFGQSCRFNLVYSLKLDFSHSISFAVIMGGSYCADSNPFLSNAGNCTDVFKWQTPLSAFNFDFMVFFRLTRTPCCHHVLEKNKQVSSGEWNAHKSEALIYWANICQMVTGWHWFVGQVLHKDFNALSIKNLLFW